ncbi:trypsin-like peptidase domain-containing protein [Streptomyces sp. CC219B]|uniref:S1C family serine protease n=1 Tax=Streptomyces sp. CC219B TaxID=3044574 RepID=UPI0024A7D1AD|nr:trypsin-like peptidase domain-containing protein [Streptomyces sp. CC219B]
MDEGKPTKAKWWSRPRLQGPEGQTEGAPPTPVPNEDGDFELKRPEVGGPETVPSPSPDDGDYELTRPDAEAVPPTRPDTVDAVAPIASEAVEAVVPSTSEAVEAAVPSASDAGRTVAPPGPAGPVDERPRPLHDPDPYSTPPYGEPGPWAPAPPVQHPAATPAGGTAIPAAPPHEAPGTQPPPASDTASHVGPPPATGTHSPLGPPPASGGTHSPLGPPPATGTPGPVGPSVPAATPWQNYDPWAPTPLPAAPLQQNGAAVTTTEQRRKRVRKALLTGAVLLALVSGGVGGVVGAYLERNGGVGGGVELPQAAAEPTGRAPDSVAGIAARALPSVVTLHVSGAGEQGTGTGFVLDERGHILTNNHVVEPAGSDGKISVTFHSGDTAEATVVGRDSGYDLAVVKVTGVSGLTALSLGNSDNVQVGDPVVAIGAPYDLEGTVTSGIISAKERPITAGGESDGSDVSYVDALQTDAPINPGNSGGPLLDAKARVIGINSAIRSAGGGADPDRGQAGSIGLGFAIPINQGKRVAEELINTGRATHPVIGVTLDMDYSGDGARVGTKGSDGGPAVTSGGPGDRAGIEPGDVITEIDGQRVHSGEELIVKTRAHRPGDRLELTLERDGKEMTISLVLGSSDGR